MSATVQVLTVTPAWRVVNGVIKRVEIIDVKATVRIK